MSLEFGKNLEQLMLVTGWNQTTLGDALGSGRGRVNNWVAGRNEPDFKTLKKISELMGIPIATLLGESPGDGIDPTKFAQICREVAAVRVSVDRIFCALTEQARVLGFDISELSTRATAESSGPSENKTEQDQIPPPTPSDGVSARVSDGLYNREQDGNKARRNKKTG